MREDEIHVGFDEQRKQGTEDSLSESKSPRRI
jgi:hypothetical protein